MSDLQDGETIEMQGSGSKPYLLKNSGGVYSCSCPAWRNQSNAIEQRTCKHLRKLRGDAAEQERIGGALPQRPVKKNENGEEETGPPILLAENWDTVQDLSNWWMSEKLDGVRAYWDGRQFLSRQGNIYHAPDWFLEGFPEVALDGELWIDRKKFQRTVSIVRRQDKNDLWKEVRFQVFDAPGVDAAFEERIQFVTATLAPGKAQYAQPHPQERCSSIDALRAELARIEALGGEGLMLRQPGSKYVAGRSTTLLKVKSFHDADAVVIGHQPGEGRHKGRLGALLVQLPNGKTFGIGTGFSDRERENPAAIGSTVTFRYQELSDGGVPRFPSWVRVRTDLAVEEIQPIPVPSTPVPPVIATAGARYFEYIEGKSSKFWEVSQSGSTMTTRWGRIGSAGQSKTKELASEAAAATTVAALIESKLDEGYVERV